VEIPRRKKASIARPQTIRQASNSQIEQTAIQHVMDLERAAGRAPEDVSRTGAAYDVSSPPRKIEVKAFSRSARGEVLALEESQVAEARRDPASYYLYVVDHVGSGSRIAVRIIHGDLLAAILDRTPPKISYWATFRVSEYDSLPAS
jgi:hypothetical protein